MSARGLIARRRVYLVAVDCKTLPPPPRPTPPTPTPPPPPAALSPIPYTIPICRGVNSIAKQAYQPGAKAPRMPVRPAIRERVGQPLRGPAKSRGGGNKKGGGRVMAPDTRSE
jgi:hypothetical protein